MATTEISSDIQNITGVGTANTGFIESAQRFVVSKIPKELLWFSAKQSSAVTDANGFDVSGSDTVLSVERNGYSAEQVPFALSKWIDDSTSLHKATALFPKYYLAQGKVFIKPDPASGGSEGYVYFVDYTQVDDDSDLRSAVIFHACSSEFTKLSITELPTVSISSSAPTGISAPSISYSNAALGDAVSTAQDSIATAQDSIAAAQDSVNAAQDAINSAQDGYTGEIDTVAPTDASNTAAGGTTATAGSGLAGTSTHGTSTGSGASDYTSPGGDIPESGSANSLLAMNDGTVNADQIFYDKWWDVLGEYIENEEDSELAAVQIQKISAYIAAFRAEVEDARAAMEATIQDAQLATQSSIADARSETQSNIADGDYATRINSVNAQETTKASVATVQAAVQASIATGQTATQASIANASNDKDVTNAGISSKTQAKTAKMQASTNAAIQKMQQSTGAAIAKMGQSTSAATAKMQQSTSAAVQKMVQSTTAAIQKMQQSTSVNIQNASKVLEAAIQDYMLEVQNYQSQVQAYSFNIQKEVSEFQNKIAKAQSYSRESEKYYNWAVGEVNMYVQNNSKIITASMEAGSRARA